jgi:hypothetical protein
VESLAVKINSGIALGGLLSPNSLQHPNFTSLYLTFPHVTLGGPLCTGIVGFVTTLGVVLYTRVVLGYVTTLAVVLGRGGTFLVVCGFVGGLVTQVLPSLESLRT